MKQAEALGSHRAANSRKVEGFQKTVGLRLTSGDVWSDVRLAWLGLEYPMMAAVVLSSHPLAHHASFPRANLPYHIVRPDAAQTAANSACALPATLTLDLSLSPCLCNCLHNSLIIWYNSPLQLQSGLEHTQRDRGVILWCCAYHDR